MTKAEILYELSLEELIGTPFEDMIDISKVKVDEYIYHEERKDFRACYLIQGHIRTINYTPEGGEFYKDISEGEIIGVNFSFSSRVAGRKKLFDMDLLAKRDSKVAYLPVEKIMDLQFKGKSKVLEKLLLMGVEEYFEKSRYLFLPLLSMIPFS